MFPGPNTYIVIGCIGLSESFSYGTLGILNAVIMSNDKDPNMFLIFFITLGVFSLLSIPTTWFVTDEDKCNEDTTDVGNIPSEERQESDSFRNDKHSVKISV